MRKPSFNKKAVSPVIATILMILIVMAGMTILFTFIVAYAQSFQSGSGSAVKESLTFEDVWFTPNNQVQVWIYNVGLVDSKITTVYVNGSLVLSPDLTIAQGGHGNFTIPAQTPPYSAGNSYNIRIVTERGSYFESIFSP